MALTFLLILIACALLVALARWAEQEANRDLDSDPELEEVHRQRANFEALREHSAERRTRAYLAAENARARRAEALRTNERPAPGTTGRAA